ncbi:hypothetical protein G6L46_31125 [Agrobacterium rhizogenes]|uniref:hypothetical protein n=1 Tax=Rhizobium rhizogenes TaxID=359 RepID=UPI0015743871|nr:hypothetical protein [Rhizobium rhizogenes]NTF91621.1 hypothetical protein [Rhizobium rhizogenes]
MSEGWGERLNRHFEELRDTRARSGAPVFALEHGLDVNEFEQLKAYLHCQVYDGAAFLPDWLLWVVYGAELGYNFNGQDYWTSFEKQTPLWSFRYNRRWLRDAFKRFHRRYRGFVPQGAWARQFSIIAWPIAHAILPQDLQTQLAQTLYQLSFGIAARLDEGSVAIGKYISGRGNGSSRFRNFLQQEEMVGRIAMALLGGSKLEPDEAILPPTLARIVRDLEKGQSARAWLGDARRVVERARIKGVGHYGVWNEHSGGTPTSGSREADPYLRPSIVLQRGECGQWIVIAQFPSYRALANLSVDIERFLKVTRCRIQGADGFRPAGWLLSDDQQRVLNSWPDTSQPFVQFEKSNATIEALLVSHGRFSQGPRWLFEIGLDGKAREVPTLRIQPGGRYILVSRHREAVGPFAASIQLQCLNCHAALIDVPAHISDDEFRALRMAGLQVVRSISIWPSGLPPRRWDGHSRADWFVGETPTFGIGADHNVHSLVVSVDREDFATFPQLAAGTPIFLSLPGLSQGVHRVDVDAKVTSFSGEIVSSKASIDVSLEVPQPWTAGATNFRGLVPSVDPPDPSLDDFFEGRTSLSILGPVSHPISVLIELFDAGHADLATETVVEASLPCDEHVWRRHSTQFIRRSASPWAYLSAASANLVIVSEELGTYRIPLRRDVRPIRLVWHSNGRSTQVRLIDDHGGRAPVSLDFSPFTSPCTPYSLQSNELADGFQPPASGGLFWLQHGEGSEGLVVSMPLVASLSDLAPEPPESSFPSGPDALQLTQTNLLRWQKASLAGPLADVRRDLIVKNLERHMFRLLCGDSWFQAEKIYDRSAKTADDLRTLALNIEAKSAFSVLMSRDFEAFRSLDVLTQIDRVVEMAKRYRICDEATARAVLTACLSENFAEPTQFGTLSSLSKNARQILRAARLLSYAQVPTDRQNSVKAAS